MDTSRSPVHAQGAPALGTRPNRNPNLDSFEAVMQAMDEELARSRRAKAQSAGPTASSSQDKGKAKAIPQDREQDIEAAMDAELKAILQAGEGEDGDEEGDEPMDYRLIKNFLESFKSQAGLSGPVSNLAGRLQPRWNLPRDE